MAVCMSDALQALKKSGDRRRKQTGVVKSVSELMRTSLGWTCKNMMWFIELDGRAWEIDKKHTLVRIRPYKVHNMNIPCLNL